MLPIRLIAVAASLAAMGALAAAPAGSSPASRPTWTEDALGRRILQPFDSAPYPHASRVHGYSSKAAGTLPVAGHYDDSTVGIFVPTGFVPSDEVNYVVHFHGWHNHVSKVFEQYELERQLTQAGVNAILIVPQGPKDAADSGGGKLEHDDGGFERLMVDVTAFLNDQHVINTRRIGHIVLSAHSGGYNVTAAILHRGGLTDHIRDVALLDASYGGLPWFVDFVKADPTRRIVSFHTAHLDAENLQLADLLEQAHVPHRTLPESDVRLDSNAFRQRGVSIASTTLPHDGVPAQHDFLAITLATSSLPMILTPATPSR